MPSSSLRALRRLALDSPQAAYHSWAKRPCRCKSTHIRTVSAGELKLKGLVALSGINPWQPHADNLPGCAWVRSICRPLTIDGAAVNGHGNKVADEDGESNSKGRQHLQPGVASHVFHDANSLRETCGGVPGASRPHAVAGSPMCKGTMCFDIAGCDQSWSIPESLTSHCMLSPADVDPQHCASSPWRQRQRRPAPVGQ
jgi:hypothetical protein